MNVAQLAAALRDSRGFAHKRDIGAVLGLLGTALPHPVGSPTLGSVPSMAPGDDCAVVPDAHGSGHLLFAIEGFIEDFVQQSPWFAGYCGVMVNVSDIHAMGGRPLAVVDALWSHGMAEAAPLLQGMAAASQQYGVPIVGGHSNNRAQRAQLAVAIVGRAHKLLTSHHARPGDALLMAVDLRGAYEEPNPFWNASTTAPAQRLRADLELLPRLAEDGLCDAAKDISMAGALGTALMLLECSAVGAVIDLAQIPRPPVAAAGPAFLRWLQAFPSYGFVLSVRPERAAAVVERFHGRELACAVVGTVTEGSQLVLRDDTQQAELWDWAVQSFIRARADEPVTAEEGSLG
jgi:AIR synthase-related protein